MRAGTENVPGIVGLGKASELAKKNLEEHVSKIKKLRDYYVQEVQKRIPNTKINGASNARLPGNSNISFRGIKGRDLLLELDNAGICVSSGSACSSNNKKSSHVLQAIGLEKGEIESALRVTFGDFNSKAEVDYLINNIEKAVKKLLNEK